VADKFEQLNESHEEMKTDKHCLEILFKREIRGKYMNTGNLRDGSDFHTSKIKDESPK
jgi:hypothetical protein